MTTGELRKRFAFEALPLALLEDPAPFYSAFTDGEGSIDLPGIPFL